VSNDAPCTVHQGQETPRTRTTKGIENGRTKTWVVMYLMASTGRRLCNQLKFVSGKIIGVAFTEEGRKHECNMQFGLDVSEKWV
jgi:hypothetical protein